MGSLRSLLNWPRMEGERHHYGGLSPLKWRLLPPLQVHKPAVKVKAATAEPHESPQVSCESQRQPGNCFDYTFPGSQKEERITKLRVEGRRDQKPGESGSATPSGNICSLA